MATAPEKLIREMLASRLGVTFETARLKVDDWGYADGWSILPSQMWLVVEMEAQQKHPTTNVLKYWPYLEGHEDQKILLAHCFFPGSPGLDSSRGKLAGWLGARLERIFDGRFFYQRLVVTETGEPSEGFRELQERLKGTS
jgi:hypothetical protein